MVSFSSFFFYLFHFAWFYGVAFVFLILLVVLTPRYASCCCFFRFLNGLETTELESGSEARVGVMLCVVHTAEYGGRWNVCYLGVNEYGVGLPLMGEKGDGWGWKMLGAI